MDDESAGDTLGSQLTLDIWHPDCWTLQVTEGADGGLFGHGVYQIGEKVKGRFTVYGETRRSMERLLDRIEASPLTDSVWGMDDRYDFDREIPLANTATQSVLVEYDEHTSINNTLISKGFIPNKAVWIHDGREYWTVIIEEGRMEIQDRLDAVREEMDAEITVRQIVSDGQDHGGVLKRGKLSERQRDIFEHARDAGYYTWPREVTATDLAADLDISKATFLEHLRKAEAKLLNSIQ